MKSADADAALDEGQAATLLGLHRGTLNRMRRAGDGPPSYKIGRAVRYTRGDVLAFRESLKCPASEVVR